MRSSACRITRAAASGKRLCTTSGPDALLGGLNDLSDGCYRPIKINTPAAIARIAMTVLAPEKLR